VVNTEITSIGLVEIPYVKTIIEIRILNIWIDTIKMHVKVLNDGFWIFGYNVNLDVSSSCKMQSVITNSRGNFVFAL